MARAELKHLDIQSSNVLENSDMSTVPLDHASLPGTSVLLMNSYFNFIYAQAMLAIKWTVIKNKCYGCQIDHPSQTEHDCIMMDFRMDDEYSIDIYFEEMLTEVDEVKILLAWEELVRGLNISNEVVNMHKTVISSKDYLEVMKTDQWKKKLRKTMSTIQHIEQRLFST